MNVQIHHLVLFVLFVFLFNVIVLAYITGAFSGTRLDSIISKISVSKPPRTPPWERKQTIIEKQKENKIPQLKRPFLSDCQRGSWKHEQTETLFCKENANSWSEIKEGRQLGTYSQIWIRPNEIALYDSKRKVSVLLKSSLAFKGEGQTSEEALKNIFDNVYLKGGKFGGEIAALLDNPVILSKINKKNEDEDKIEENEEEEEEEEEQEPTQINYDVPRKLQIETDCSRFWFHKDENVGFCKLKNENDDWFEIEISTSLTRFHFKELYSTTHGEVGIFDKTRLIVITLLQRFALIGHPENEKQAMDISLETDDVFIWGGGWREEAKFKLIPPKVSKDAIEKASLLIMISSFRDALCSNTIKEAFTYAYNPSRVRIAIVNQADTNDPDCLEVYCQEVGEEKCHRNQVTQIRLPLDKSRGVMFARFLQQTLIKEEEFCLQIDSHMVFPTNWDKVAIEDWLGAENEMAVMTTYPNRANDREDQVHSPIRCNTVWGSNVVACGTSAHNIRHDQKKPHLSAFFGAGIAFSKCHANLVVPYDPYMAFMFKGEEYNRSARLWTHGYDLYAPKKNYAYHFYDDDPRPEKYKNVKRDRSFFGSNSDSTLLLKQSEYRWQAILGMLPPNNPTSKSGDVNRIEKLKQAHAKSDSLKISLLADIEYFGIGNKRSLREYQAFSGINLAKHTAKDMCDKIGKMPLVPWVNEGYESSIQRKNFLTIFNSYSVLGNGCSQDATRKCCQTTMDKILEDGRFLPKYMGFSNDEWTSNVKSSSLVTSTETTKNILKQPIESIGWSKATKLCE